MARDPEYIPGQSYRPASLPPQTQATAGPVQDVSFTNKAVITMVLYLFGYLPGLIANNIYWYEAKRVKRRLGYSPAGQGCITALLWIGSLPIFLVILLLLLLLRAA